MQITYKIFETPLAWSRNQSGQIIVFQEKNSYLIDFARIKV